MNNENFVYVKDGEISLTERFAQKQYVYPRRIYEGMEFFVDTDTLTAESAWIQKEFGIDFHKIIELFAQTITLISQQLLLKLKKY